MNMKRKKIWWKKPLRSTNVMYRMMMMLWFPPTIPSLLSIYFIYYYRSYRPDIYTEIENWPALWRQKKLQQTNKVLLINFLVKKTTIWSFYLFVYFSSIICQIGNFIYNSNHKGVCVCVCIADFQVNEIHLLFLIWF